MNESKFLTTINRAIGKAEAEGENLAWVAIQLAGVLDNILEDEGIEIGLADGIKAAIEEAEVQPDLKGQVTNE